MMWNYRWISFLFLLKIMWPVSCFAQGTLERIDEFASHSLVFDVPSIFHFDITMIKDGESTGLTLRKVTGRFVQGERLGFRIDLQEMGDADLGREFERQHFLAMPNGERFFASERPSVEFYSHPIDPTIDKNVRTLVSRGNPFRYVFKGCQQLHSNPETDIFGLIRKNFEELDSDGTIRNKVGPSAYQIDFDKETPWQINRLRAFITRDKDALMRKKRVRLESTQELKNWLCARDLRVKWREVDGAGLVPYWIHSTEEGLLGGDPKFAEQMEAFFFGFQFDNIPLERIFDKSRLTQAQLKEDFKLEEIEQLKKMEFERLKVKK